MARIDEIHVLCCAADEWWLRACVASLRHWHPDRPVFLVKDQSRGPFCTRELEKHWQVGVLPGTRPRTRMFIMLESIYARPARRVLILDADTVLTGPLLDRLDRIEEEIIVDRTCVGPFTATSYEVMVYDWERLRTLDPDFREPEILFNTGLLVVNTGCLEREEMESRWITGDPPELRHPEVFRWSDQGLLNYILTKGWREGRWTLNAESVFMAILMGNRPCPELEGLTLARMAGGRAPVWLLHWAGEAKPVCPSQAHYGEVLGWFENLSYSRIPWGRWLRWWRLAARLWARRQRRKGKLRSEVRHVLRVLGQEARFQRRCLRAAGE